MNNKSFLKHLMLRLPNGDLYKRRKKAKYLLTNCKKDRNEDLLPFAEYFFQTTSNLYYHGGKNLQYNYHIMEELLTVQNEMICIKDIQIPVPKLQEFRYLFEYEFYDLILPYLITPFDHKYDPLYHEGPYELNESVCVNDNDIVFDCGANMGCFSAIAGAEASKGKVYSFEPSSYIIESYLSKTAANAGNILIEQYALSDTSGKMDLFIDREQMDAASLNIPNSKKDLDRETVNVITLDEFVENNNIPYVSFIKADIEGAERNMLKGATKILQTFAPKLAICTYHLKDDPEVLESIIKTANPNYIVEHKFMKLYAYCN